MYQFDRNYAESKLIIGAIEFASSQYSIDTIKTTNGCYDGNAVGVGSVYIRHAEVTMERIRGVEKGIPVSIYFKVNSVWREHGEYYVKEIPVVNGDKMTLQLQGVLSKYQDVELVFSGVKQTYTLNDVKEKIESITGSQIVFLPEMPTETKKNFLGRECCFLKDLDTFMYGNEVASGINVRSALSGLAILFGGNVYEEHGYIYIKSKTYRRADASVISKDDISGDYSFSQLTYAIRSLNLSFLPWGITGRFWPPNASEEIITTGYLGNDRVSNILLKSQLTGYALYDYTIECDWIGWTSDGSKFDHTMTPGGRTSECLHQRDLIYKSGTFNIVGYEITGLISPGNIVEVEVQEETDPISIYCGEITLEWDGGFRTTISCNCNIEDEAASSSAGNSAALTRAAAEEAKINLYKLKFADIELSNIKDSTIKNSMIADSEITNPKIKDGEIENSKIKDATLTGAKIKDATIAFEKVDKSFISNLIADEAYISSLKAEMADIGYLTVQEADIAYAKIKKLEVLEKQLAEKLYVKDFETEAAAIGCLTADTADLRYANIELSNVDVLNVGTLFANVGLIDRVTIVGGHITGFLDGVEVNANKITAGTLIADRILIRGSEDGLLYALNNLGDLTSTRVDTLDGYVLTDRTINADKIVASSITSNELDVDNIFANQAVISKITSQEAFINAISSNTVVVGAKESAESANDKIDNLEIGGPNLFPDSLTLTGSWWGTADAMAGQTDPIGSTNGVLLDPKNSEDNFRLLDDAIPLDGTYAISFWAKATENCQLSIHHRDDILIGTAQLTTDWKLFKFVKAGFKKSDRFYFGGNKTWTNLNTKIYIAYPKLEKGNRVTGWSESQDDISVRNIYTPNTTTIDGGKITTNSIKASSIDVDNLFAQNITATGTITGATLKGTDAEITNGKIGNFSLNDGNFKFSNQEADLTLGESGSFGYGNYGLSIYDYTYSTSDYCAIFTAHALRIGSSAAKGGNISFRTVVSNTHITTPELIVDSIKCNGNKLGFSVTMDGNFTCYKYDNGKLLIEYREKITSQIAMTLQDTSGVYFAFGSGGTFPITFKEVPSIACGLSVPDDSSPFVHVTFDVISKTGFLRKLFWGSASGGTLPVGTVIGATFTGSWK